MSLLTVQPTSGTNQNNGDSFYGWMGWKITVGAAPIKLMQVHVAPIYTTAPGTFAIFDYVPADWTDENWLISVASPYQDDSENSYYPEAATLDYTLNAATEYYLCVRSPSQITPMDYPFWDLTGLLPVATTGGYFTLDAAILENSIPSPASSWPFAGPIYEVIIETVVASAVKTSTLMMMGV